MKKSFILLLAVGFLLSLAACGAGSAISAEDMKIGVILSSDGTDPYNKAHLDGIYAALEANGLEQESNLLLKTGVAADETCYDTCAELVKAGCSVIFATSYDHQASLQKAAAEFINVQFVSLSGDTAASLGLDNLSNAANRIHEARYVSGVVAGLKLAELADAGQIPENGYDANGNVKVGYVGAFPNAQVVSGYTAFYLGIQSVFEKAVMSVRYTNAWADTEAETAAVSELVNAGCVMISHHTNSTAVPAAVQAALDGGKTVYCVGYQQDMRSVAPTAALTSAVDNWAAYYTYAISQVLKGDRIPANQAFGYDQDAVGITDLGPSAAADTADQASSVAAALKEGSLQVFSTDAFTVGGEHLTSSMADVIPDANNTPDTEVIENGVYQEAKHRSAPYFELRIDGITELNAA